MKNIHVLPTDKPSRLYFNNNDKCFQLCKVSKKSTPLKLNKHIYITSDEEIKEGDWVIETLNNNLLSQFNEISLNQKSMGCKKVIMTTDKELIKDGVQAIDDNFIEWFVKNPSCEEVEVGKTNKLIDNYTEKDEDKWEVKYHIYIPKEEICSFCDGTGQVVSSTTISRFKTCDCKIIPKEEPKQECLVTKSMQLDAELAYKSIPKQETLEEVAERLNFLGRELYALKLGAKWQQEPEQFFNDDRVKTLERGIEYLLKKQDKNKYSEEEVLEILNHHTSYLETFIYQYIDKNDIEVNEDWFEQFKKK
jgi:hypothetical protein